MRNFIILTGIVLLISMVAIGLAGSSNYNRPPVGISADLKSQVIQPESDANKVILIIKTFWRLAKKKSDDIFSFTSDMPLSFGDCNYPIDPLKVKTREKESEAKEKGRTLGIGSSLNTEGHLSFERAFGGSLQFLTNSRLEAPDTFNTRIFGDEALVIVDDGSPLQHVFYLNKDNNRDWKVFNYFYEDYKARKNSRPISFSTFATKRVCTKLK